MIEVYFTNQIFKEGNMYVAYTPEFGVSTCGYSIEEVRKNAHDAVRGFLESARDRGVLEEILEEAGYRKEDEKRSRGARALDTRKDPFVLPACPKLHRFIIKNCRRSSN